MSAFASWLAVIVMAVAAVAPARAACRADSGDVRAVLVELYTSEGCSSCPPADRQLGQLTRAGPRIVPLAMHVDYWDSIGWKDPFAQPSFARRQAWEVQANQRRTSYTPHFFVNGREVLDWRADLKASLAGSTAPANARILVKVEPQGASGLLLQVDGTLAGVESSRRSLQMFVVVTEGGLSSQVDAGENRGAKLDHEAVARHWIGPIAVQGQAAHVERLVDVPQWKAGHVGVVAFIQDANTAEVLQAVDTGFCKPS